MTSKPLPRELFKFIPHYDGTAYKLLNILEALDKLFSGYRTETIVEKDHNYWLTFKVALSKFEGPAEAVTFNNNRSSLTELKISLKNNFADKRSVPDLIAGLTLMKSKRTSNRIS